ncbi:hypothetical protein KFU94_22410 [Chloroflexi bacterium TSY]|nr:hypothetical protein [Chloroflexi bacterium TSY]
MATKYWNTPQSRSLGLFTDLRLFYQALEIANESGIINNELLESELPQRLQGLKYVEKQSNSAARDLIRELRNFYWIAPKNGPHKRAPDRAQHILTLQGKEVLALYESGGEREFLRRLSSAMQKLYTIPGWFVYRLWEINPDRQGEIVVPVPPRGWSSKSRLWDDNDWTSELTTQTQKSLKIINDACPGAMPIDANNWESKVRYAWNRLGALKPRQPQDAQDKGRIKYSPRRRLAFAMREAAVNYLFGNSPPGSEKTDFGVVKPPLASRTYMGWCPRLEALELIYYTDVHPAIPGRLIFPTSVFRTNGDANRFEVAGEEPIRAPTGQKLWLHRPQWNYIKSEFFNTLYREHQRVYSRLGALYVSILDVRDEVCRQLRISGGCFDEYIESALRESVLPGSQWSISVETDIREDQRSAPQLYRRPVWISGTPYSLIAVTETEKLRSSNLKYQKENLHKRVVT